jgi:hypothetical protein
MASGTETNAKLLSHSSPIESTFKKAEGGRSSSSKTKLSLHGRRSSTAIPTKDGCSQLAAATVSDELDNEGIKSQTGDLEALEGLETAETFTDWADKGSEEHQLCILSGEVSTSQSHASSPADSPAVGGQASSLRSHEKVVLYLSSYFFRPGFGQLGTHNLHVGVASVVIEFLLTVYFNFSPCRMHRMLWNPLFRLLLLSLPGSAGHVPRRTKTFQSWAII